MFVIISTVIIAIISVVWAFASLRQIQKGLGRKEALHAKQSLKKERVIFHS